MHVLQVATILLSRGVGSSLQADDWERLLLLRSRANMYHEEGADEAECLRFILSKVTSTKVGRPYNLPHSRAFSLLAPYNSLTPCPPLPLHCHVT